MKKTLFLVSIALFLVSCTTPTPVKPVEPTAPATPTEPVISAPSTESGITTPTGSGYDDKEVEETMKEIDAVLLGTDDVDNVKK